MNGYDDISGSELADLVVHLARLAQSPGRYGPACDAAQTLTAAQWTALRYFARANRFSRTPSAFSEFHATTRGTASQTVKSLVALGLLSRQTHATDGRSAVMEVTRAGYEALRHDPMAAMGDILDNLAPVDRKHLAETLAHAMADLARRRNAPIFGNCSDCRHCEVDQQASFCHCTQNVLSRSDMRALCVDFEPSTRTPL